MMASHSNGNMEQIMDVSVASSFGSPIMFNPSKRGLEASAGVLKDILLGTIHILRKYLYSTKLNLTSKFLTRTEFFRQNKEISF